MNFKQIKEWLYFFACTYYIGEKVVLGQDDKWIDELTYHASDK